MAESGIAEQRRDDPFTAGLRAAGLKVTAQRAAICAALAGMAGKKHPTVQEIFEAARQHHPGVSLATVYNTLTVLKERGLVYELGPDAAGAVHYELDVDTHVNVICIRCKQVIDLHHISTGLEEMVQAETGYQLVGAQMLYYGICPSCARSGAAD
nr:MAG: transcriptional repressor [Bacillota bacterium]